VLTEIPPLDSLLHTHAGALGGDFAAYRNHTYRVANFCAALSAESPGRLEKIAIAAACHDLGIWTNGTFDYLPPSVRLARAHLAAIGREEWSREITAMIEEHHKITAYRGDAGPLVEAFRRADWIDVSRGLLTFGQRRADVAAVLSAWPNAGFHKRLVQLTARRALTHPWSPLPMFRL